MSETRRDVVIVGGGVSGLTASLFTARAGLSTRVLEYGGSILKRNAHLENFPGFPLGVNARRFLDLLERQADNNGVELVQAQVTEVGRRTGGFLVSTEHEAVHADQVIAACWSSTDLLDPLGLEYDTEGSKRFVRCSPDGSTALEGFFVAGRLAGKEHQAIVSAGHGAEVGLAVVRNSGRDFYHDWVTPEGYFTERGREVPPGCEEISPSERLEREGEARAIIYRAFSQMYDKAPRKHPKQEE